MKVITREFYDWTYDKQLKIIPISDVHIGAASCDEERFRGVVQRIAQDPDCYWVGGGDYCDFIQRTDKRYGGESAMAEWCRGAGDIARVQAMRFLDVIAPIAHKCLGVLQGNHETAIFRKYERDIYSDILSGIRDAGKFPPEYNLMMDYYGWLVLKFYRSDTGKKQRCTTIKTLWHHGFVGGKLAGAKALDMQRWLWTHDADLIVFGHSHNTSIQPEAVEGLDQNGNLVTTIRKGTYAGTFLRAVNEGGSSTYAEVKGYLPLPMRGVEIVLQPAHEDQGQRVKLIT